MLRSSIARLAVTLVLLVGAVAAASAPGAAVFGPTDAITIAGLRRHLNFIASDALEGRDALSPGFRAAAEYIASSLDRIGAMPAGDAGTYFQHLAFVARGSIPNTRRSRSAIGTTSTATTSLSRPRHGDGRAGLRRPGLANSIAQGRSLRRPRRQRPDARRAARPHESRSRPERLHDGAGEREIAGRCGAS